MRTRQLAKLEAKGLEPIAVTIAWINGRPRIQ